MKTFTKIATFALSACMVFGFAACNSGNTDGPDESNKGPNEGSQDAGEVVVWGGAEDQTLLKQIVEEFKTANPDVKETIRVEIQDAWDAQSVVSKDPEKAADVILIPHDQIGIMAKSGLLGEIRDGTAATFATDIRTNNDPKTVQQATYDGKLYGFPLTMDTYIEYYTTNIFPESIEDSILGSVDDMLAAPMGNIPGSKEKATAFGFNIGDGFYLNMGFAAVGCTLFGKNGDDVNACNWNNANGLKFMQYAAKNFRQSGGIFKSDDAKNLATAVLNNRLGACISGAWEMQDTFKNAPNIKYRTLPSITIDGEQKPLIGFSNSKQYVVNNMSKHKGTAIRLAAYITSEKNQLRYAEDRGYYPSNLAAQQNTAVKDDPFFKVIRAQLDLSVAVPSIPEISRYWEAAKSMGTSIWNGSLKSDDAALQASLDEFVGIIKDTK